MLFKFLYILFEKKFAVFRDYLLENQILEYICKSTNYASILILFVFKKNSIFRFCINYRKLNSITIKNRYLLFFIEKTLNRLIDIYYFIKLDLKNIYYCICIQKKTNRKLHSVHAIVSLNIQLYFSTCLTLLLFFKL